MTVKILVLSDSHGSRERVSRICAMHPDADYIIHCGDGASDLSFVKENGSKRICVRGNCDIFANHLQDEEYVTAGGYKFLVCHGDSYGVKFSMTGLERASRISKSDIVVFGHTHVPVEKCIPRDDGTYLYLFNPGSVREGSFGLIQIKDGSVIFSHGTVR